MATIPLIALQGKAPEQQDSLQQYGRLLQIKNMQREAQMAPFQMQAAQNEAQASGLDLQQKQQALKDQQAATAAMHEWDGSKLEDLAPLMIKNGASATAVMSLKKQALEQREKYSSIAKDDAATGASNIATMMKKNDMVSGALSTVMQAPDEQLPQALTQTAQQLAQQGLIDPQHAQQAAQLAQSGAPAEQLRQQIDLLRKGYLSDSQLLDEAQKKAAIAASKATADKTNAEMNYYARNGGAPGVPVEAQQQADWLKKNPGKGPSDFLLWKQKNSPAMMTMSNMFAGEQNAGGLDIAANNYRLTGQLPSMYRSPESIKAIINRAAEIDQAQGGQGIAVNKTMLAANKSSLTNLQKNFDQVQAFEGTALKNIDLLQKTAASIPDLGARFANVPVRMLNARMLGSENMAKFNTALNTAQTEAAKVLNSSNASGVLSDSARHELQEIIDGNLPYKSMVASLDTLRQDMANRTEAYKSQISDIQGRIKGSGSNGGNAGGNQPSAPMKITLPSGKTITIE